MTARRCGSVRNGLRLEVSDRTPNATLLGVMSEQAGKLSDNVRSLCDGEAACKDCVSVARSQTKYVPSLVVAVQTRDVDR